MFREHMVETERKMGQGHVSDLYRDAEMHRLALRARAGQRRTGPDLARPAAWAVAELRAAGMQLRQRFFSPCGQFKFWRAEADC